MKLIMTNVIHLIKKSKITCMLLGAVLAYCYMPSLQAQLPTGQLPSGELQLKLQKLNTLGSVLYIAAHPDDENTRLLSYLANERKLRTGYLSLTRGDGGQNLIGKEQGELLGLIRTQELLAARNIDGAEQFFTRAYDFGYSKKPDETLQIWNKDSVLSDMVWIIRNFRPDVIICRFPTTGEGGHGHHTASALLAAEAFDAAGDSTKFPWQLVYTNTWKTRRLFWNTFNFGGTNTTAADQLKIDVGVFNPLLGKSYGEIAAESRSNHKSQGFGSARVRGSIIEYFKQLKGDSASADLFEGIDMTWGRIGNPFSLGDSIEHVLQSYEPMTPEKITTKLLEIDRSLRRLPETDPSVRYWKTQKILALEPLIEGCSGLWAEATSNDPTIIVAKPFDLSLQLANRGKNSMKLERVRFSDATDSTLGKVIGHNELLTITHAATADALLLPSSPYWLSAPHPAGIFNIPTPALIGSPQNRPPLSVTFNLSIENYAYSITRPVTNKFTDPVKGEIYRPVEILPPVTFTIQEKNIYVVNQKSQHLKITLHANINQQAGSLSINPPDGWRVTIEDTTFLLVKKGDEKSFEITLAASSTRRETPKNTLEFSANVDGKYYDLQMERIDYDHIPLQFKLSKAAVNLHEIELKTTGVKIGYIEGAGDAIPQCLTQLGYEVHELSDKELVSSDLSIYQSIITGVRAYNMDDRMQKHYDRLMDYIQKGGNLLVQYNTNNRIGPVLAKIGPYPFNISRDRVTDESAAVNLLQPEHPVFNTPNKIVKQDFDGWIQERGIYFASDIDSNYVRLISMHDPDEKALDGSLIIANYGKGHFIYTGLSFFRELPAAVPGAARLFVNLISLPKMP